MRIVLDTNVLISAIFFACALAARVRTIVSGDKHLLAASAYAGVRVLRPKAFVDKYL